MLRWYFPPSLSPVGGWDTDVGRAQAVNGLQRREIFEGNKTEAAFYPKDKFEALIFE